MTKDIYTHRAFHMHVYRLFLVLLHELNLNKQIRLFNFVALHGTYMSLTLFVCTAYGASVPTVPHCTEALLNYLYSKAAGTDVQLVLEKTVVKPALPQLCMYN